MNVQHFLQQAQIPFEVLAHAPTYDAQHMAQAVHTSGHEVAKTVLLRGPEADSFALAVLPATRKIDFVAAAKAWGQPEVSLASERDMAELCPDCEVGALPPFGSQLGVLTIVDESLTLDEIIVFEGNTHSESIRLKFADFQQLEQPLVARIAHY